MDRQDLSAAMIQELGAVFTAALDEALPALRGSDLAEMEQRVRTLGRAVLGQVITRVIRLHATRGTEERGACPGCGGTLACVDGARVRRLQGLVGDYTLHRVYYRCARCGQGHVPLDAQLGLGTGVLSPGLARVVCREGIDGACENAVDSVAESRGVTLTAEVARRTTAGMGLVAEAPVQAAMARVARGQRAWAAHAVEAPPLSGVRAVEVDGLFVHRDDDWHAMKVVTVAPLGPEREVDADTGRERLAWGEASYGAGFEEAQAFWGRAHGEACRRGLGTRAVRTVVLIADAAAWIWHAGRAFLGLPGVELVEILDLYHVYEYLWMVGNTVFGAGTAAAAGWVEPLKTRLYAQGPAPVHAALVALADILGATEEVTDADAESGPAATVRRAIAYVTEHAARLDYPSFVARAFPIGSGAVESSGKSVVQARTTGAGMRWSAAGAHQVVSMRALHRSGRWDAFWQSQPQRARLRLVPRQQHQPAVVPAVAPPPPDAAPTPAPPAAPPVLTPPHPLRPAADHPWRRQPIGRARSA
jgi:hypothetical protein